MRSSRLPLLLFLLVLDIDVLLSPGRIGGSDATEMLRLTEAISTGTVAIDPVPGWSSRGPDGRFYSRYGLGYPFAMLPFHWLGERAGLLSGRFPPRYFSRFAVSLVNPIFVAGSSSLLLGWLLRMGFSARRSLFSCLAFAFTTIVFVHAKEGVSEPTAMFFLLLAFVSLRNGTLEDKPVATCVGVTAFVFSVLTRPLMAVTALPLALFFVPPFEFKVAAPRGRYWFRHGAAAFIPLAAGVLIQVVYNLKRFGTPLSLGYGSTGSLFFLSGLGEVLSRFVSLLFSPGAGLFTWQPLFLLVPFGIFGMWKRSRRDVIVSAALLLFFFIVILSYSDWFAAPRLLSPVLPFLVPFVAAAFDHPVSRTPAGRWLAIAVVGVSLLAQLPHILVSSIRFETRLKLQGKEKAYWSLETLPALGGWRDVSAVASVQRSTELIYSEDGLPVGDELTWFKRSATLNSFSFWFVHAARLGVSRGLIAATLLSLAILAVALAYAAGKAANLMGVEVPSPGP